MIHRDKMHRFNEVILYSMFDAMLPFLIVDIISMPLQPVTSNFFLIVNIILLHELELLAECYKQEAHKSNANNLLQLKNTNVTSRVYKIQTTYMHTITHTCIVYNILL